VLDSLRVKVDVATSTAEALDKLPRNAYDGVISDMRRGNDETAGLELLGEVIQQGSSVPFVFTVGAYDPSKGIPPYAFGITNRVDELMNLVFDILERRRG
jgi:DNA-binding NtrC family response regulator